MKVVALISEFNPFHRGHTICLDAIREAFGDDTCIVALMSGNYTQRGEVAIAEKFTRAKAAVEGGVDLVLEIPFPYTVSSAEFYATAGVRLASAIGADALAFGSECGDIATLSRMAAALSSESFRRAFDEGVRSSPEKGHPQLTQELYGKLFSEEDAACLSAPNNVLGIEYLRANNALEHPLTVFTAKRHGSYHDKSLASGVSGSAVRAALERGDPAAYGAMPESAAAPIAEACRLGHAPASLSRMGPLLLSYFRTTVPAAGDALGHRFHRAACLADTFETLQSLVSTKRYSHAHLLRAMWHRFFGITSADLRTPPAYSQILGIGQRGRTLLRALSGRTSLSLLTKPADARQLEGEAGRQAALSQRADLLYPLAMPKPTVGNASVLASPYCKE